jgi:hypothetical protein
MCGKRFSNQSADQVVKHLINLLNAEVKYNLSCDPLYVHFTINEAVGGARGGKGKSEKRLKVRAEQKNLSKGKRKHLGTKKTTRPKIRSIKKGRTVALKGRVY